MLEMSAYIHDFSYTEDDILTSDRLLEFSRVGSVADYIKIDYFYWGCRPIYWRGGAHPTCPPQRNILITGHGDFPITKDVFESARTHIPFKKWFGTNVEYDHPDLKPIPLGITNCTNESAVHPIYGDTILLYMNFDTNTYPQERVPLQRTFKEKPWVHVGKAEPTREGRRQFLQDIYNSKFVLCPRGNGVDSHRIWESLYMRSIPIVKRHLTHKGLEDLPILFIDSWDEITEDYLEFKYVEMASRKWNFEKLKMGWWKQYILNTTYQSEPLEKTCRMNVPFPRLSVKDSLAKAIALPEATYEDEVIFHAYWDGQLAEKHLTSLKSCWYHNVRGSPKRSIIVWTAGAGISQDDAVVAEMRKYAELRPFDKIKEQAGTPLEGEKFFCNPRPSFYSDVVRYTLLHKYGGVWFDLDIFFTRSLDPLLVKYKEDIVVYEWEEQKYPNGALFMCLESRSAKLTAAIEFIKTRNRGWGFQEADLTYDLPLEFTVLPCGWFDPMWLANERGLHFNDFFSVYLSKHTMESLFPGAFCIHWHNQFGKEPHAMSPYAQLRADLENKL